MREDAEQLAKQGQNKSGTSEKRISDLLFVVTRETVLEERPASVLCDGFSELFLCRHDKGPSPRNRLIQFCAWSHRNDEEEDG